METTYRTEAIADFCQRHHIIRMMVFGSVLRGDDTTASDIDILVEFERDRVPGFLAFSAMQRELSTLFERPVDLNTPNSLSRYFRQQVLDSARVIYEKTP